MQVVLKALCLKVGVSRGVEPCLASSHGAENVVHVFHKLHGALFSHVLVKIAAKLGCNVILSVGQGACAAVAVHNVARSALDAFVRFAGFDGAYSLLQGSAFVNHENRRAGTHLRELVGREHTAGPCSRYYYVVVFHSSSHRKSPTSKDGALSTKDFSILLPLQP